MKSYSPSQTTQYMICPVLWHNSYKAGEGGKGLYALNPSRTFVPKVMGELWHLALKTWYLQSTLPSDQRVMAAMQSVEAAVTASREASQRLVFNVEELPWGGMAARVGLLLKCYATEFATEAWQSVLGVELLLTDPCTMKLDMAVIDSDGEPTVVEHKWMGSKGSYEKCEQAVEWAYRKWRRAYQPRSYAWGLSQACTIGAFAHIGKPCRRVEMNLAVETGLKGKPAVLARRTIEIEPHQLMIHQDMARGRWAAMEKAETNPDPSVLWPNEEACDSRYGLCEFWEYCQSGWDSNVEARYYLPRAGLRKETPDAKDANTPPTG